MPAWKTATRPKRHDKDELPRVSDDASCLLAGRREQSRCQPQRQARREGQKETRVVSAGEAGSVVTIEFFWKNCRIGLNKLIKIQPSLLI